MEITRIEPHEEKVFCPVSSEFFQNTRTLTLTNSAYEAICCSIFKECGFLQEDNIKHFFEDFLNEEYTCDKLTNSSLIKAVGARHDDFVKIHLYINKASVREFESFFMIFYLNFYRNFLENKAVIDWFLNQGRILEYRSFKDIFKDVAFLFRSEHKNIFYFDAEKKNFSKSYNAAYEEMRTVFEGEHYAFCFKLKKLLKAFSEIYDFLEK